jgi:hypothetical protein
VRHLAIHASCYPQPTRRQRTSCVRHSVQPSPQGISIAQCVSSTSSPSTVIAHTRLQSFAVLPFLQVAPFTLSRTRRWTCRKTYERHCLGARRGCEEIKYVSLCSYFLSVYYCNVVAASHRVRFLRLSEMICSLMSRDSVFECLHTFILLYVMLS